MRKADIPLVDTCEIVMLKYKIRDRFYAFKTRKKRTAITQAICKKCGGITDHVFRNWMNTEVGDGFEIPLVKLKIIADELGCTWVDLLNDTMREELELL